MGRRYIVISQIWTHQMEQFLEKFTSSIASSIGFSRLDKDTYERRTHDATALLMFPCHLSPRGAAFTARVGLRFDILAPWLNDESGKKMPTFAVSINLLREDKSYTEWEFSNPDELEKLRVAILDDLNAHAMPFIERYSHLLELRKTLESSDKKDWIGLGLNLDTRVTTLAAIQLVNGDKSSAITTLDGAIKSLEESLVGRTHELRKRRFEIDYLRKRVLVND